MATTDVFFDLGGTLFAYGGVREAFDRMLGTLAASHGIAEPPDALRRAYRDAIGRQMARSLDANYYLHKDLFVAAQRDWLSGFGVASNAPDDALYQGQNEVGFAAVKPRDGVHETLQTLRERGLRLSIVSNIDDDQFHPLWERIGLAEYFDATTTSEEARSCKPHRGIYEHALAKVGAPDPSGVVFVGDSPPHDIAGARPLGMTTVLITPRAHELPPEQTPHHRIGAIPELLEIVRG